MKECKKTDFRMYSPLVGPAEEICWTCGVGKESHFVDQRPAGITSGAALKYQMPGLSAWLPQVPISVGGAFVNAGIFGPGNALSLPASPIMTFDGVLRNENCTHYPPTPSGTNFVVPHRLLSTFPIASTYSIPESNALSPFPPSIWVSGKAHTIFGVDTSPDVVKLAGFNLKATKGAEPTYDAICRAAGYVAREGGDPRVVCMQRDDYILFERELKLGHSTAIRNIGTDFLTIHTAYGVMNVYSTLYCPKNQMYILDPNTWRSTDSHGAVCNAPGYNARVEFL